MKFVETIKARQRARILAEARPLKPADFLAASVAADMPDEPALLVVALTVAETDEASDAALKYKRNAISQLGDKARDLIDEPSLFADAECVEKLYRACRDPKEPSERLFASADELRGLFTTEELALLYSVQVEVQHASSPIKAATLQEREVIAAIIANSKDGSALDSYLARFPRLLLSDLLIWSCKAWKIAREEADAYAPQAAS